MSLIHFKSSRFNVLKSIIYQKCCLRYLDTERFITLVFSDVKLGNEMCTYAGGIISSVNCFSVKQYLLHLEHDSTTTTNMNYYFDKQNFDEFAIYRC